MACNFPLDNFKMQQYQCCRIASKEFSLHLCNTSRKTGVKNSRLFRGTEITPITTVHKAGWTHDGPRCIKWYNHTHTQTHTFTRNIVMGQNAIHKKTSQSHDTIGLTIRADRNGDESQFDEAMMPHIRSTVSESQLSMVGL